MKKVLIVEDYELQNTAYKYAMKDDFVLLFATNHEDAIQLFITHPDVALIVMDGCLKGDVPDTIPLVKKIRETFSGPIIATSSVASYRQKLLEAGCNYQCEKSSVAEFTKEILCI